MRTIWLPAALIGLAWLLVAGCRSHQAKLGRHYEQHDWSAPVPDDFQGAPGFIGHRWIKGEKAIGYNIQLTDPVRLDGHTYRFLDVFGVNVPDLENGRRVEVSMESEDVVRVRVLPGDRSRN